MKKQEKSFNELLNEVIQQAKREAARNQSTPTRAKIDKSANIIDEWSRSFSQHRSSPGN